MKAYKGALWLAAKWKDSPLKESLAQGARSLAGTYALVRVPASKNVEVYKFACDSGRFFFKQYHWRSPWDRIKHLFRPSRAARTVTATAMLEANGFAAPEIVAMGGGCPGWLATDPFLLTCEVENSLSLHLFVEQRLGPSTASLARKREFIRTFGRFVGRLHARNISHGDLHLCNILVRLSGEEPSENDFVLIDNERTVQFRSLPDRLRLKNLVQCNLFRTNALSSTDRMRFFKSYLAENSALTPVAKAWLRRVVRITEQRLAKRIKKVELAAHGVCGGGKKR